MLTLLKKEQKDVQNYLAGKLTEDDACGSPSGG